MSACSSEPETTLDQLLEKEQSTVQAARAALDGRMRGLKAILPFLGPAFVACVAYIDPGNFATNIQGGSALATICSGL